MERINLVAAVIIVLAGVVCLVTGNSGIGAVLVAVGAVFAVLGWRARP